jgi:hypothetical protein
MMGGFRGICGEEIIGRNRSIVAMDLHDAAAVEHHQGRWTAAKIFLQEEVRVTFMGVSSSPSRMPSPRTKKPK